jgi:hypothetical protein
MPTALLQPADLPTWRCSKSAVFWGTQPATSSPRPRDPFVSIGRASAMCKFLMPEQAADAQNRIGQSPQRSFAAW